MTEKRVIAVAKAIWDERVRHAKEENGIDLEAWAETVGFRIPEPGEPTVAELNNILGEARAAIAAVDAQ